MVAAAYVLMFEQAAAMDGGLPEDEQHFIYEMDVLLNHADDESPDQQPTSREQRLREIEEMRSMAARVNAVWGGDG